MILIHASKASSSFCMYIMHPVANVALCCPLHDNLRCACDCASCDWALTRSAGHLHDSDISRRCQHHLLLVSRRSAPFEFEWNGHFNIHLVTDTHLSHDVLSGSGARSGGAIVAELLRYQPKVRQISEDVKCLKTCVSRLQG